MKNSRRWPVWLVIVAAVVGWYLGKDAPRETAQPPTPRATKRPPARAAKKPTPKAPVLAPESGRPPLSQWEQPGNTISDTVERVTDGDTVVLKRNGKVRLIGIDAPESKQPGGAEATEWARRTLEGKRVEVQPCAKQPQDRYGRMLAFLYYRDRSGQLVPFNREMVWRGYARVYSLRPCTVDKAAWEADYEAARAGKRGLFHTLGYVPDAAAYRRRQRGGTS